MGASTGLNNIFQGLFRCMYKCPIMRTYFSFHFPCRVVCRGISVQCRSLPSLGTNCACTIEDADCRQAEVWFVVAASELAWSSLCATRSFHVSCIWTAYKGRKCQERDAPF